MPTTTNFGWTTPADTALVKDGASAIRTLGSGIDTSFVDFKGGTTGQVLKKTSGTDLDVEWGTASSGLTLINTTSFSGVASQAINSVFSATYINYRIVMNIVGSTASNIRFKMRVAGTDNSGSYYWLYTGNRDDGSGYAQSTAGDSSAAVNYSSTQKRQQIVLDICRPFEAEETSYTGKTVGQDGTSALFTNPYMFHAVNTSYDGFNLIPGSGTITGTVRIYGYAN